MSRFGNSSSSKYLLIIVLVIALGSLSLGYSSSSLKSVSQKSFKSVEVADWPNSPPKPGWIDPFDMIGDGGIKPRSHEDGGIKPRSHDLITLQDVKLNVLKNHCSHFEIFLQRLVNSLLRSVHLKDSPFSDELDMSFVELGFAISGQDVGTLNKFGHGGFDSVNLESISLIFDKMFNKNIIKVKEPQKFGFDSVLSWIKDTIIKIISSPEWTVVSSVLMLLLTVLWLVYKTQNYRLALFTFFMTVFVAGFGFNWIRLIEEKEIERYYDNIKHGSAPYHCTNQPMAWYEHIYYRMFGDDCLKFYLRRDVRPIIKVSPLDVFVKTICTMIVEPAEKIGKAYGSFVSSLVYSVPYWIQPFVMPFAFLIPLVILAMFLILLFKYHFSVSLTGIHLYPSGASSDAPVSEATRKNYVEEVPRTQVKSESVLSDEKTPLFLINWRGMQKLMKSSHPIDGDNKGTQRDPVNDQEPETMSSGEDEIKSVTTEARKGTEKNNCRRRSKTIYTSVQESPSGSCGVQGSPSGSCGVQESPSGSCGVQGSPSGSCGVQDGLVQRYEDSAFGDHNDVFHFTADKDIKIIKT